MKIMLKPFAMLRESLPPEAKNQELEDGSTVADLLAKLQHSHPCTEAGAPMHESRLPRYVFGC